MKAVGFVLFMVAIGVSATMASQVLSHPSTWTFSSQGAYVGKTDRRDLYQIIHPWTSSKAGDFGQVEAEVAIPRDAQAPFFLVFYVTDSNYGEGYESGTGVDWINNDVRVGHRFKQALVNGEVVWSEDTCLNEEPKHYVVEVTDRVRPGDTVRLAFRLWEAADSDVTLPGDIYVEEYYLKNIATATKEPSNNRYETKSYWGDVAIHCSERPDSAQIPWGLKTELKAPAPAPPTVAPARHETRELALEKAELLAGRWPWPVSQGIPFPMGALRKTAGVSLYGLDGALQAEVAPHNDWPDGSARWLAARFTLPPGATGPLTLQYGARVRPEPVAQLRPVTAPDGQRAGNGIVAFEVGPEPGEQLRITAPGGALACSGLEPYLSAGERTYRARWTSAGWLSRTPQEAELDLRGELLADDGDRYGRCRLRLAVFADCPYVRLLFTITNERPEPTFVTQAYGLRLRVPGGSATGSGDGWLSIGSGGGAMTAVVRYFKKLWPNGIAVTPEGLDLQLVKPGDGRLLTYNTHPGEAKTHEIWLALTEQTPSAEDCATLAALVESPPRLDVSALIRESGVWGLLPEITPESHPEVYARVNGVLGPYFSAPKEGIRLFGEYPNWDNFYWNTLHTMYCLYAMTGERRWYDAAEASVRHLFDVDICHWQPDEGGVEGAVVGGIHQYWGDHSDTPCGSLIQNCDGPFDHWNMTLDPDGFDYGVGVAEYVRASKMGSGASTREQGWPIICSLAAWRETGDERYGDRAKELVETALGYEEPRRGTYIEVHGSMSHRGPTPFMYGILATALRQYHLRTGDARAAMLIARLANSVYEESHDPWHTKTAPNIDYYYSPNPYLRGGDGFTPITTLNLNIAAMQAYGAYVTQDAGLGDIARRSWLAGLNGGTVYAEMSYDLAGVVYWLDRIADLR